MNLILAPKKLSKRLIFNTRIIDEETIMDKTTEGLNDPYLQIDKYWIENEPGTSYFTLRLDNGR